MKTADIILDKLKRDGSTTAKQLSEDLSMTSMGARQHLLALQDLGFIEFYDVKVKIGRPTRNWKLTEKGHNQFSDRHNDLSIQMIDAVGSLFGQDGIAKVTQIREQQMLTRYQAELSDCPDLESKINKLTQLRDADGYMAEIQRTEQGYLLIENHCPICKAATRCPSLCQSELNLFQAIFGNDVTVKRTEHIVSKSRRCVYLISSEPT